MSPTSKCTRLDYTIIWKDQLRQRASCLIFKQLVQSSSDYWKVKIKQKILHHDLKKWLHRKSCACVLRLTRIKQTFDFLFAQLFSLMQWLSQLNLPLKMKKTCRHVERSISFNIRYDQNYILAIMKRHRYAFRSARLVQGSSTI